MWTDRLIGAALVTLLGGATAFFAMLLILLPGDLAAALRGN